MQMFSRLVLVLKRRGATQVHAAIHAVERSETKSFCETPTHHPAWRPRYSVVFFSKLTQRRSLVVSRFRPPSAGRSGEDNRGGASSAGECDSAQVAQNLGKRRARGSGWRLVQDAQLCQWNQQCAHTGGKTCKQLMPTLDCRRASRRALRGKSAWFAAASPGPVQRAANLATLTTARPSPQSISIYGGPLVHFVYINFTRYIRTP
jgi:hypothetical protein